MKLLDRLLNWLERLAARLAGKSGQELRLYAILSREAWDKMDGNLGKLCAQAGHAYVHAWWDAMERFPTVARQYRHSQAAVKVCLWVSETDQLQDLHDLFEPHCGVTHVRDAGRTVFKEPTVTFVGVGPITRAQFEEIAPGIKPLNNMKPRKVSA